MAARNQDKARMWVRGGSLSVRPEVKDRAGRLWSGEYLIKSISLDVRVDFLLLSVD